MDNPKRKRVLFIVGIIMIITVIGYTIFSGSAKDFINMCQDFYFQQ